MNGQSCPELLIRQRKNKVLIGKLVSKLPRLQVFALSCTQDLRSSGHILFLRVPLSLVTRLDSTFAMYLRFLD